jgi:gamma-glutamylcyclotransferase (GGCT)/AIG2-like uncharacterized protein YtfP
MKNEQQNCPTAGSAIPDRPAPSGKINLFVYGSLMYEPVWRRLVAGEFERKPAQLSGYRRLKIKNEDYPGLVRGIGTVLGIVWLAVDEQTLQRIDDFEAACYRRISGLVTDVAGVEIPADFFVIKESETFIVEEAEWDVQEFEHYGLLRFIDSYAGFKELNIIKDGKQRICPKDRSLKTR